MKTILTCVGTRPNFIKVMLLKSLFEERGFNYKLLHTGQHFDTNMSDIFFRELQLGAPDHYLGIGSGSNAEVVGRILEKAAVVIADVKPELVIVPGDVNSTFACAFAAASQDIPVAHIESGLRSFDMSMPEERNRILTDHLSALLFTTEPVGEANLVSEGVAADRIKVVGNTIIDALITVWPLVEESTVKDDLKLKEDYILTTFHRPVNVDDQNALHQVVEIIKHLSAIGTCVFPIHPRTKARLETKGWLQELATLNCKLVAPLGYIEFLELLKDAACVVSDSGGVQVECSYLNVPLVTVRETTECRITLERGTNTLCPLNPEAVVALAGRKLRTARGRDTVNGIPGLWDGHASERIVEEVIRFLA